MSPNHRRGKLRLLTELKSENRWVSFPQSQTAIRRAQSNETKSLEAKKGMAHKQWEQSVFVGALDHPPPTGRPPTTTSSLPSDRKVEGTTSQGDTGTSARGSGPGRIPEEVLFLRSTAEFTLLFYFVSQRGLV